MDTRGEQTSRCIEQLTRESGRAPWIRRSAHECVRSRRAQLENGVVGIARAIDALHADVEDGLLVEQADAAVWHERKSANGARDEHRGAQHAAEEGERHGPMATTHQHTTILIPRPEHDRSIACTPPDVAQG
jgi:hypothetical protein